MLKMAMFLKKTQTAKHGKTGNGDRLFDLEGAPRRKKTTYFKFPPFKSLVQLTYSNARNSTDVESMVRDDEVFYPEGFDGPDILHSIPKFSNPESDSSSSEEERFVGYDDTDSSDETFSDVDCENDGKSVDEDTSDDSYSSNEMESMVTKSLNIVETDSSSSDEEDEFVYLRPPIGHTADMGSKRSRTPTIGTVPETQKKLKPHVDYSEHEMLDTPPIKDDDYNWPWLN
ncbi:hypothetical protein KM546_gp41 [Porcine lymphotropic herpesvirus 3]|uniref:Uncharacterized protein n=1 Tax=Suid gammaherpesvirus 5 TaxID=1960251 RepID=Q8B3X7_9GAMA|nr:hypothetical protein KM546_gp41 [Porcine lymphotropic herpesvirus 3]AAO12348.1 unknown [Porcine lymphotropic herpesvirus 3]